MFYYEGYYYNFYYAPGSGLNTVKLARTMTPQNASSWEHITTLPWHRNGCVILRKQPPHYVLVSGTARKVAGLPLLALCARDRPLTVPRCLYFSLPAFLVWRSTVASPWSWYEHLKFCDHGES